MRKLALALPFIMFIGSGCAVQLTPELVEALAKDQASFCLSSNISGGAGGAAFVPAPMVPLAGYGQGTLSFCRSNQPNAEVSIGRDGEITIKHAR